MTRLFSLIVVLMAIGFAVPVVAETSDAANRPRPRVIEYDFGVASSGQEIVHEFHIDNPTDRDIPVNGIHFGCSCTTMGDQPTVIRAITGSEFSIHVHIDGAIGELKKTTIVKLGNGASVALVVRGKVVEMYPKTVQLGTLKRGEKVSKEFTIRCDPSGHLRILGADYDAKQVSLRFIPRSDAEISVSVETKSIPEGPIDIPVVIHASGGSSKSMSIRLQGRVLKPLEVDNRRIVLRSMPGGTMNGRFRLYAPYGGNIIIQGYLRPIQGALKCGRLSHQGGMVSRWK